MPARRPLIPIRRRRALTAAFPGADFPVGSRVRFLVGESSISGSVAGLERARAVVLVNGGERWKVPYGLLSVVERTPERECTLGEVEALARRLFAHHRAESRLGADWTFGFDLSPVRAGACRYEERRIELSVSYCQRAMRAEIEDTLLHEIAHAIVGLEHRHDEVWKAKAREIGCTAERCHRVTHTVARWVGECGCGKRWFRQRLGRTLRRALCKSCGGRIGWRPNAEGEVPARAPVDGAGFSAG